ncbi:MAG: chemotaxis protein CheW, partial [Calditrichaeota bacterium]|nr:chemotaxis protein CheW [Calditrichota bacterium]
IVVDTVSEVINISNDNIEPTPKLNAKAARNRYVKGLGKSGDDVKIIVDTQKLLFDAELDTIINSIASDA